MERQRLFDYLASQKEPPLNADTTPDAGGHYPRLDWNLADSRPIFRMSGAMTLARRLAKAEYTQRTVIAPVPTAGRPLTLEPQYQSYLGYVYPTDLINASYAAADLAHIEHDNNELTDRLGLPRVAHASVEWDIRLLYKGNLGNLGAHLKGATVRPRLRPQFSPALPLPSHRGEWRCIASGTTQQTLLNISAALGSGQLPLILLTGPPGSGKEAYAETLHYGRSENWDEDKRRAKAGAKDRLVTISLAGTTVIALDQSLKKSLIQLSATGGTLFLDETDKPDGSIRSFLLRLLETRKYSPLDGSNAIDCEKVAFVVGAGKSLSDLRDADPPDFWTRMELHIEVGDPLLAPSGSDRQTVLEAFFLHFWWDVVSRWLEGVIGGSEDESWKDFFVLNPDALPIADAVFDRAVGVVTHGSLERSAPVLRLAQLFGQILAPHLERRQLSVRGLRSCVKSIAWDLGHPLLGLAAVKGAVPAAPANPAAGLPAVKGAVPAAAANPAAVPPPKDEVETRGTPFEDASILAVSHAIGTIIQVLPS